MPHNLTARAQTWSNYKHNNTIKYLASITPSGAVNFISKGWGGRVSNKEITLKSGYIYKLSHGDEVLTDRGFLVSEEIAAHGVTLRMPSFTRGKKQLSAMEVHKSKCLSNVRIHVERVIGKMRNYLILQSTTQWIKYACWMTLWLLLLPWQIQGRIQGGAPGARPP